MRKNILYTLLVFILFSCKTEKKQTPEKHLKISHTTLNQEKEKSSKESELIGKTYHGCNKIPELKNYNSLGGFIIGNAFESNESKRKIYFLNSFSKNNFIHYILLYESIEINGKNMIKILDLVNINKIMNGYKGISDNQEINIYSDVFLNGKIQQDLIALALYEGEEKEMLDEIYKVWRLNRDIGKLEELKDIRNIKVFNGDD